MSTVDDLIWNVGEVFGPASDNDWLRSEFNARLMEHDANNYYKRFAEKQLAKVEMWNEMRKMILASGQAEWIEKVEEVEQTIGG